MYYYQDTLWEHVDGISSLYISGTVESNLRYKF